MRMIADGHILIITSSLTGVLPSGSRSLALSQATGNWLCLKYGHGEHKGQQHSQYVEHTHTSLDLDVFSHRLLMPTMHDHAKAHVHSSQTGGQVGITCNKIVDSVLLAGEQASFPRSTRKPQKRGSLH